MNEKIKKTEEDKKTTNNDSATIVKNTVDSVNGMMEQLGNTHSNLNKTNKIFYNVFSKVNNLATNTIYNAATSDEPFLKTLFKTAVGTVGTELGALGGAAAGAAGGPVTSAMTSVGASIYLGNKATDLGATIYDRHFGPDFELKDSSELLKKKAFNVDYRLSDALKQQENLKKFMEEEHIDQNWILTGRKGKTLEYFKDDNIYTLDHTTYKEATNNKIVNSLMNLNDKKDFNIEFNDTGIIKYKALSNNLEELKDLVQKDPKVFYAVDKLQTHHEDSSSAPKLDPSGHSKEYLEDKALAHIINSLKSKSNLTPQERELENTNIIFSNKEDTKIKGTYKNDHIHGTSKSERIFGRKGDDIIYAGKGNDYIKGGAGNDVYVYNLGDGNKKINATLFGIRGETDTLKLSKDIKHEMISFEEKERNLILHITDEKNSENNGKIEIKLWKADYSQLNDFEIEGKIYTKDDIKKLMNIKKEIPSDIEELKNTAKNFITHTENPEESKKVEKDIDKVQKSDNKIEALKKLDFNKDISDKYTVKVLNEEKEEIIKRSKTTLEDIKMQKEPNNIENKMCVDKDNNINEILNQNTMKQQI